MVNLTVTEAQLLRTKFGLAAMRIGSVVTYDKTRAKQYLNIRWVGAVTSDSNGKKITPTKRVRPTFHRSNAPSSSSSLRLASAGVSRSTRPCNFAT